MEESVSTKTEAGTVAMDQLATPLLSINRNVLMSIGLWPHQTGILKHLFFINMLFFTVSQCCFQLGGMIAAWEDKDVFLESIPPVLVDFLCGAKLVNFIVNSDKMKDLLIKLEEDWRRFKDRKELKTMKKYALYGRNFTLTYAGCLFGSMAPFMIVPTVPLLLDVFETGNKTHEKLLMFRVDFLLDTEKYYYYLLIHSYIGTVMYIILVVAIDSMRIIFVQHACGCFAVLEYQLEHLTDNYDVDVDVYPCKNTDLTYDNMSACLAQHNHALEYSKLIEDSNYISYFFQLGITMVCLSFTAFQTVMHVETPPIAVRYFAFTLTQLFLLFLQSYPGQMLYDHSIQVSEYVHNCGWYLTSMRTRKLVCVMIMRSRIPCTLTAGKFYELNLANFGSVVRTSISYLTVLTSVK